MTAEQSPVEILKQQIEGFNTLGDELAEAELIVEDKAHSLFPAGDLKDLSPADFISQTIALAERRMAAVADYEAKIPTLRATLSTYEAEKADWEKLVKLAEGDWIGEDEVNMAIVKFRQRVMETEETIEPEDNQFLQAPVISAEPEPEHREIIHTYEHIGPATPAETDQPTIPVEEPESPPSRVNEYRAHLDELRAAEAAETISEMGIITTLLESTEASIEPEEEVTAEPEDDDITAEFPPVTITTIEPEPAPEEAASEEPSTPEEVKPDQFGELALLQIEEEYRLAVEVIRLGTIEPVKQYASYEDMFRADHTEPDAEYDSIAQRATKRGMERAAAVIGIALANQPELGIGLATGKNPETQETIGYKYVRTPKETATTADEATPAVEPATPTEPAQTTPEQAEAPKDTFDDVANLLDKFGGYQRKLLERAISGMRDKTSPTKKEMALATHGEKAQKNSNAMFSATNSNGASMTIISNKLNELGVNVRIRTINDHIVLVREGQPIEQAPRRVAPTPEPEAAPAPAQPEPEAALSAPAQPEQKADINRSKKAAGLVQVSSGAKDEIVDLVEGMKSETLFGAKAEFGRAELARMAWLRDIQKNLVSVRDVQTKVPSLVKEANELIAESKTIIATDEELAQQEGRPARFRLDLVDEQPQAESGGVNLPEPAIAIADFQGQTPAPQELGEKI